MITEIVCGELTQVSAQRTCICPGDVVIYECTVMGGFGGTTVFKGKSMTNFSFDICTRNELTLFHDLFNHSVTESVKRTCNNGTVIGQILTSENDTYTSQLNVTVTNELLGAQIECIHDNGTQRYVVGTSAIINDTGESMRIT